MPPLEVVWQKVVWQKVVWQKVVWQKGGTLTDSDATLAATGVCQLSGNFDHC
jgi:hypothetical protein